MLRPSYDKALVASMRFSPFVPMFCVLSHARAGKCCCLTFEVLTCVITLQQLVSLQSEGMHHTEFDFGYNSYEPLAAPVEGLQPTDRTCSDSREVSQAGTSSFRGNRQHKGGASEIYGAVTTKTVAAAAMEATARREMGKISNPSDLDGDPGAACAGRTGGYRQGQLEDLLFMHAACNRLPPSRHLGYQLRSSILRC
jgi:hypothetical protein